MSLLVHTSMLSSGCVVCRRCDYIDGSPECSRRTTFRIQKPRAFTKGKSCPPGFLGRAPGKSCPRYSMFRIQKPRAPTEGKSCPRQLDRLRSSLKSTPGSFLTVPAGESSPFLMKESEEILELVSFREVYSNYRLVSIFRNTFLGSALKYSAKPGRCMSSAFKRMRRFQP